MAKWKPEDLEGPHVSFYVLSTKQGSTEPARYVFEDYETARAKHPSHVIFCRVGRRDPFPIMPGETPVEAMQTHIRETQVAAKRRQRARDKKDNLVDVLLTVPADRADEIKALAKSWTTRDRRRADA